MITHQETYCNKCGGIFPDFKGSMTAPNYCTCPALSLPVGQSDIEYIEKEKLVRFIDAWKETANYIGGQDQNNECKVMINAMIDKLEEIINCEAQASKN